MGLERVLKNVGRIGEKILYNIGEKEGEKIESRQITSVDLFPLILKRLIYEGNYNKAENILFEELSKNSSYEMYQIAVEFYNELLRKSDDELINCGFSREEIYQGLEDIKKYKV